MEFQLSYFKILKDDTVKVPYSIFQQIWKTQQWPQDWKISVSFQSQRRSLPKTVQTTAQLDSSHMLIKVVLKIFQASFQQYMNHKLPDVQAGFRKGRGIRDQIANICWIIEKQETSRKKIYFCFIDYTKALTLWITTNCRKFFKRWEYQTTLPASWEICMQVKKQQLELDMEQWTGSK